MLTGDASDVGVGAELQFIFKTTDDVMFLSTRTIPMNTVISHNHYIYIASPLLKKKLGYKLFAINLYFNIKITD
jgi:hypothetical protein